MAPEAEVLRLQEVELAARPRVAVVMDSVPVRVVAMVVVSPD